MVYVDDAAIMHKGKLRYHMTADSLAELHTFCADIGIARCWFHAHPRHPHYDVTTEQRTAALDAGAQAVDSRTLAQKALLLRTDKGKPAK